MEIKPIRKEVMEAAMGIMAKAMAYNDYPMAHIEELENKPTFDVEYAGYNGWLSAIIWPFGFGCKEGKRYWHINLWEDNFHSYRSIMEELAELSAYMDNLYHECESEANSNA